MTHHLASELLPPPAAPLIRLIGRVAQAQDAAWTAGHALTATLLSIMEAELRVAADLKRSEAARRARRAASSAVQ
ncbi:MAG TPA: hypothetical protein VNZ61_05030 [Roseomonas sp.]|nr:hypothetical protein [Roseomonas sp.]